MVRAAEKYNRVVQVGQWQRSDPHWQDAMAFVHSGKLGKIRTVRVFSYQGWCPSIPVKPDEAVPAWITRCGLVRLPNGLSTAIASISLGDGSGIMPAD